MNKNTFSLWLRELYEALRAYDWRLETNTLSVILFIKFLARIGKKKRNTISLPLEPHHVAVIYRSRI